MPAFILKCRSCDRSFKKLANTREDAKKVEHNCECGGGRYELQLSSNVSTMVYETRSRYHGKSVRKNIEKTMKHRSKDHARKYELEERIDKHGLDEAVKDGLTKKIKKL